ncbi:hypothetical protein CK910_08565 [Aeromonas sp. CA23]|uniref:pYEATS domain-containing protein n=1 Tax=Aeromonas sp. CA23 TaxID=2033032 RepID=UPI000BFD4C1C|nr:pYEATS domain-containing protein [Aeromonas sp. CA23]ATL98527.1 hypothetical protein CK910_08565 [Aeromonas sp. CA23]
MSHDITAPRPLFKLSLRTRPGIAIRLLDSNLKEITRGSGELETEQPEGLYLVQWSSAGHQSTTMARVDGSQKVMELRFDPSDMESSTTHSGSDRIDLALIDTISDTLKSSGRIQESAIVLIVTGDAEILKEVPDLRLRLFDRNDTAMRRDSGHAINLDLGSNEQAYAYRVKPGRFHIGFQSVLNERLGLAVPALAGRQTLVFLTVTRTKLIVPDDGQFVEESSVGIDPVKTTIVTVRGDEETYRVRERVRLAGLLLYDLSNGTNSLSRDVVSVLDDIKTDPLVRLYGALAALSAYKRGEDLGAFDEIASVRTAAGSLQPWVARICDWIPNPGQPGLPTDALAAHWELARAAPGKISKDGNTALPTRIETPPMLECAWLWAIEESIVRPDAIRGTALVAAATRSSGGTAPWLCWRLSASKARSRRSPTTEGLPLLAAQVIEKLEAVSGPRSMGRGIASKLKVLSPEIQATALRVLQIMSSGGRPIDTGGITDLAVSLGLPAQQLRSRLDRISKILDTAATSVSDAAQDELGISKRNETAPGLLRRVEHRDDLQNGRFGGMAGRAGFKVSAEFEEGSSKNWVRIKLHVKGPSKDGEEVEFHLHDSFKPSTVTRRFKKGAAQLVVSAWGGFTVGIWIPVRKVELELNLAKLKAAPQIIRER